MQPCTLVQRSSALSAARLSTNISTSPNTHHTDSSIRRCHAIICALLGQRTLLLEERRWSEKQHGSRSKRKYLGPSANSFAVLPLASPACRCDRAWCCVRLLLWRGAFGAALTPLTPQALPSHDAGKNISNVRGRLLGMRARMIGRDRGSLRRGAEEREECI